MILKSRVNVTQQTEKSVCLIFYLKHKGHFLCYFSYKCVFFCVLDFRAQHQSFMLFSSFKRHQWDSCFIVCWIRILKWCYWSCLFLPDCGFSFLLPLLVFLFTSDGIGQDCFLIAAFLWPLTPTGSHHWVLLCNQLIVQVSLTLSVFKKWKSDYKERVIQCWLFFCIRCNKILQYFVWKQTIVNCKYL